MFDSCTIAERRVNIRVSLTMADAIIARLHFSDDGIGLLLFKFAKRAHE